MHHDFSITKGSDWRRGVAHMTWYGVDMLHSPVYDARWQGSWDLIEEKRGPG